MLRVYLLFLFMLLFSVFLLFKGAQIQFFPDERLITTKKRLFEKMVTIKPRRGGIYDRYGRELALSISSYSLFADPSVIKNTESTAQKLSSLLKISKNRILKKIKNKKKRFVWIKRHLSEKEKTKIDQWSIYGLGLIEESKRVYPNGVLMSQVLGFTGSSGRGLEGLEFMYDDILRGREQKMLVSKDARGRTLFIDEGASFKSARGSDLYLTIDSDLQFVLERELSLALKKFSARFAMGLILDAQTSEILAMAHSPGFDANHPFRYAPEFYRNHITASAFEPGSTFKTFVAAAALKEGVPPHTQYDGMKGKLKIGKHTISEAEAGRRYGRLSMTEILSLSSNVGSAMLALSLKDQPLYSALKEFGFGEKMQAGFPLEGKGVLPRPPWKDIVTGTIGFGQGVSATPLQMTAAFTSIANGGFIKRPYIIKSIVDLSGREKKHPPAAVLRRVLTREQAAALTLMLTQAVSEKGTGYRARIQGFLTAGKTGTAQKPDLKKGGYEADQYISSFIGFVPADRPKFVIYTALDSPQKLFYGSVVAAPVFSSVGHYAIRRSGISPSFIEESSVLKQHKTAVKKFSIDQKNQKFEKTPSFKGLSLREALQKARKFNVKLKIKGSGLVRYSSPFAGEPLPKNRVISITLGSAPSRFH